MRSAGYEMLDSFRLPADDWRAYFAGIREPLREAIARYGERQIYSSIRLEAEIHEEFGDEYGYLCLLASRVADG